MNINATSSASLVQQLFKSVDANNDGKLNSDEFQSFLETLVGAVSGKSSGTGTGTTGSAIKRLIDDGTSGDDLSVPSTPSAASRVYQGMLGFDYVKLNTPSHTTAKYVFARATQDIDFAFDRESRSTNLQKIADYAKDHGYPDAKVTGDDTMDFGDGYGDIDVLTGDGQWWWGPKS
jgi:hypothetical protein